MERRLTPQVPLTLAALVLTLVGCSEGQEPETATAIDPEWYDALDSAVEAGGGVGPIPKLERGECPLGTPEIAGEEVGGEARVGAAAVDGSRRRLVCEWPQPETELVVVRFEDPTALESAREEVAVVGERDLGVSVQTTEEITVDGHDLVVRRTVETENAERTSYYVSFFDDDGLGMATLDVAGPVGELPEGYTSQQAAEDLAALLP
ncbi:hypothetical protein [Nocardioides sp.]|uniref:hypothetical protein n=1 Tax=Nocardioides sp. TaxID=35761 RepID=UPI002BB265EC|nr:hypothetical protein [Nocardioides sp.]HXH77136.1 hypothetical protein [Nocardioides sp.]